MVKKILYIGKSEFKQSIIKRTKNENAYVFNVSCFTTAGHLLTKVNLDQVIVEYEVENMQMTKFINSVQKHKDFYKIPLVLFTITSEGIKFVTPFN